MTQPDNSKMIVQKDTRPKKPKRPGVLKRLRNESAKVRKARKNRNRHRYADPFPEYKTVYFKNKTRKPSEDASDEEKADLLEASVEKALVLEKPYSNLPTRHGIQIGKKRGNGKTFVGSKGRIKTRRRIKATRKGKKNVMHG